MEGTVRKILNFSVRKNKIHTKNFDNKIILS